MITHLEPDILECEVKWVLESIIMNKASGGDGIPVELFQILKDDAVKVLHSICQQIWKTQQWPQEWKRSVFISIPNKGNAKECSNYRTIALISHASKVMLKILQARLQQYVNRELPDIQAGFIKGRGTRDQIANIHWIMEKAREFQKNIYFCFIDYAKAFGCVDHNKLWKILEEIGIPDHLTCLLSNLYAGQKAVEPDMKQHTPSKLGKEYVKTIYCHPVYLTSMQSTSRETLDWKKHKLESRLLGEISITSDMQMTTPSWQKSRRNKEPLDEGEKGECKSWLKTQHSKN
ncbi:reverse transcriptase family protein [Cutibacterium acnes]